MDNIDPSLFILGTAPSAAAVDQQDRMMENPPRIPQDYVAPPPVPITSLFPHLPSLGPILQSSIVIGAGFKKDDLCRAFKTVQQTEDAMRREVLELRQQLIQVREVVTAVKNTDWAIISELRHRVTVLEYENAVLKEMKTLTERPDSGRANDGSNLWESEDEDEKAHGPRASSVELKGEDSDGPGATEASKDNRLTKLVTMTFHLFLGVSKLTKSALPDFPGSYERGKQPLVPGTKIHGLFLDWSRGPKEHPNDKAMREFCDFARAHGGDVVAGSSAPANAISYDLLLKKFCDKFTAIRRNYNKAEVDIAQAQRTKKSNRALGKLDTRMRKLKTLPEDHELRHPRFDEALEVQIQSDDEDNPDDKNTYLSRAPTHRSSRLQEWFDSVDALKDPIPAIGSRGRVRGAPKETPLHRTKELKGRTRRWMVNAEWLAAHPESDTAGTLADNGTAWDCDDMDPAAIRALSKAVVVEKKEKKENKRKEKPTDEKAGRKKKTKTK